MKLSEAVILLGIAYYGNGRSRKHLIKCARKVNLQLCKDDRRSVNLIMQTSTQSNLEYVLDKAIEASCLKINTAVKGASLIEATKSEAYRILAEKLSKDNNNKNRENNKKVG